MLKLLQAEELDLDCGGPKKGPAGGVTVEAFVAPEVARRIEQSGYRIEIDERAEERAAERQKEVGDGNRFQRGGPVPRGVGRKEG